MSFWWSISRYPLYEVPLYYASIFGHWISEFSIWFDIRMTCFGYRTLDIRNIRTPEIGLLLYNCSGNTTVVISGVLLVIRYFRFRFHEFAVVQPERDWVRMFDFSNIFVKQSWAELCRDVLLCRLSWDIILFELMYSWSIL